MSTSGQKKKFQKVTSGGQPKEERATKNPKGRARRKAQKYNCGKIPRTQAYKTVGNFWLLLLPNSRRNDHMDTSLQLPNWKKVFETAT